MNYKIKIYYFLLLVLLFFSIFGFLIFYTKSYNSINLIDSGLYKKTHFGALSDRITRFYILNKNNSAKHYILGASSAWTIDPLKIKKKLNEDAINLSLGGAKINELEKYIYWISKNKVGTKSIMINIEPYSFNNLQYSRQPFEIQMSLGDKLSNFFNWMVLKDTIKLLLIDLNLMKTNINSHDYDENKLEKYFYTGLRYYPEYFEREKNLNLKNNMIKNLSNNKINFDRIKFDIKSINSLKRIKTICEKNNIKLILYFDPVSRRLLEANDYEFLYSELKIVKKIVSEIQPIYYFNNFNIINNDLSFMEDSHHHYNYDAANLILQDLLNLENYQLMYLVDNKNFQSVVAKIIKNKNSKKLNALLNN